MPVAIVLDLHSVERAREVAVRREKTAQAHGWQHAHGWCGDDPFEPHIEGACAELAVAVLLDRPWIAETMPDGQKGDVVPGLQVRATRHQGGHLILHPTDLNDHFFVLVTGVRPNLTVVGGLWARDGKRQEWWREPQRGRPCFMVPPRGLRDWTIDRRYAATHNEQEA